MASRGKEWLPAVGREGGERKEGDETATTDEVRNGMNKRAERDNGAKRGGKRTYKKYTRVEACASLGNNVSNKFRLLGLSTSSTSTDQIG